MTPEELDALAEEAAEPLAQPGTTEFTFVKTIIRSAISQALSLQRESVIEECAKVAINYGGGDDFWKGGIYIAKAIRALKG